MIQYYKIFQQEFEISSFEVNCPAVLYQIPDIFLFDNVDTLLAYIEFLLQNINIEKKEYS